MKHLRRSLLLLLAAALLVPAAADARPGQTVYFEAPSLRDAGEAPAALEDLETLGVRALRVTLFWRDVAPAREGGSYDFSRYDRVVQAAEARGWEVLLTVSGPIPKWASKSGRSEVTNPVPSKFRDFAELVGQRYGTTVERFAIWNEPNHPDFLRPQYRRGRPVSGALYRKLALAGMRGLRASGVASSRVLLGETAPVGTSKVVAPLTFLRQTLCLDSRYRKRRGCGRLKVGGWAHHPYTRAEGPFSRPESANAVTIGVLSRLVRALQRAERAGALPRTTRIYITEFGVQSYPDRLAGVSLLRQSEYRSIAERIAWDTPRVASFSQFLLKDDKPVEGAPAIARYPGFETGLRTHEGRKKPAFDGFRLPVAAYRIGSRTSLFGLVRNAPAGTAVEVRYNDGAGPRKLTTVRTDRRGAWRLRTGYKRGRRYSVQVGGVESAPARAYLRRR